jgi:hypothetical protein
MELTVAWTNLEAWGLIPDFLDLLDERDAVEQIHENYQHGGGWRDCTGSMEFLDGGVGEAFLVLNGEVLREIARCQFRDESLFLLDYEFVLWRGPEGGIRVARIN